MKKNKKLIWSVTAIAITILLGGFWFLLPDNGEYKTVLVERGAVEQDLLVTGVLQSAQEVDLAFEKSGRVSAVLAEVGDQVAAGEVLVELDSRDARIGLEEARSAYQKLTTIDQVEVSSVRNDIKNYEDRLSASYDSARATVITDTKDLVDVVDRLEDLLGANGYLRSLSFYSGSLPARYLQSVESGYYSADRELSNFLRNYNSGLLSDPLLLIETLERLYQISLIASQATKDSKDLLVYLKNNSFGDPAAAVLAYEEASSIANMASDNLNTLLAARNQINESNRLLEQTKIELVDLLDGPDLNDLRSASLVVERREKEYQDLKLVSPIDGVVSVQLAKIGQQISAGLVVVSIISVNDMEIKANVPEVLVGQVKVGDTAVLEFDAFPGEVFPGEVVRMDPAQTLIDGVVNYKVTVALTQVDQKLRSGMTANVNIKTISQVDALLIPQDAVSAAGSVEVISSTGKIEIRPVKLGVRNNNGLVAVESGLTEGEMVLVRQK